MRLTNVASFATPRVARPSQPHGTVLARADEGSSRALVSLQPVNQAYRSAELLGRTHAPFLAQLIATRGHLAQTRGKRRAGFAEATAAYRAAAPRPGERPRFSRRA